MKGTTGINMEENIKNAIAQIRPYLQRDGGDIQFIEYTDDHIVKVQLQGHCAGCPGATMTIKGVIERLLGKKILQKQHQRP